MLSDLHKWLSSEQISVRDAQRSHVCVFVLFAYLPWCLEGSAKDFWRQREILQGTVADTCNFCLTCLASKCR